jgi:hypothetical protein
MPHACVDLKHCEVFYHADEFSIRRDPIIRALWW